MKTPYLGLRNRRRLPPPVRKRWQHPRHHRPAPRWVLPYWHWPAPPAIEPDDAPDPEPSASGRWVLNRNGLLLLGS